MPTYKSNKKQGQFTNESLKDALDDVFKHQYCICKAAADNGIDHIILWRYLNNSKNGRMLTKLLMVTTPR